MKRQIFIGDVQGCFDEFLDLTTQLQYDKEEDELYLVGDVINRGPKSHLMMQYLVENPAVRTVIGNHEVGFIRWYDNGLSRDHGSFLKTYELMGENVERNIEYLRKLPTYIENDLWILVHAGLAPFSKLSEMDLKTLTTVRMVNHNGKELPWDEYYSGDKLVIFGHWAMRGLVKKNRIRGLDTGCVYGNELTALVLPEDKTYSCPARRVYYDHEKKCETW